MTRLTEEQQKVYRWSQNGQLYELTSFLRLHPTFSLNFKGNNHLERPPLHEVVENGRLDMTEFFINNGAQLQTKDIFGATPLHTASEYGHLDIAKMLIQNGADVLESDNYGNIPLHWASARGHAQLVDLLINNTDVESVNLKNNWGKTPLHDAMNRDVARTLIKHGAHVMSQDIYGNTPLHEAIDMGRIDVACLLIQNRADVNTSNKKGKTPLDLLSEYQQNHPNEDLSSLQKLLKYTTQQPQSSSLNQKLASIATKTSSGDNQLVDENRLER